MSITQIPRIGAEVAGYRLESLISKGGMAVVYVAERLRLRQRVAMKILAPELAEDDRFRERFLREARLAATISHQNIVPMFDAGEDEGLLYIAMRYVDGPDLKTLIHQEGQLDPDRAVSIISQAGSALEAAHGYDLVHRDVKPGNMLIVPRVSAESVDHVYLTDFGLTKHKLSKTGLTQTGQFVGTVDYIAPEQFAGEGEPVDRRADIYALGCVLYECLVGRVPFDREDDRATLWAHIGEPPPRVSDRRRGLPIGFDDVVAKAMAKSPDERYDRCSDFVSAARHALHSPSQNTIPSDDETLRAPAPSLGGTTTSPSPRRSPDVAPALARTAPPKPPAPPSSPEPPAGDHRGKNSRRFGRLVIPMTLVLLLGALVGAAAAYALVNDGNASTDHETRPGLSGSVYDEIVLAHVPANIQKSCRETRQPSDVQPGAGQATASCTVSLPHGSVRLWYTKVHNSAAMRDSFFEVARRELNLDLPNIKDPRRTTGDCLSKGRAWTFWHRPVGSEVMHRLTPANRAAGESTDGRVICFPHGRNAVIEWTDRTTEMYTIAESTAGVPELISWYSEDGGPLLNPAMHGGDSSSGHPHMH